MVLIDISIYQHYLWNILSIRNKLYFFLLLITFETVCILKMLIHVQGMYSKTRKYSLVHATKNRLTWFIIQLNSSLWLLCLMRSTMVPEDFKDYIGGKKMVKFSNSWNYWKFWIIFKPNTYQNSLWFYRLFLYSHWLRPLTYWELIDFKRNFSFYAKGDLRLR